MENYKMIRKKKKKGLKWKIKTKIQMQYFGYIIK